MMFPFPIRAGGAPQQAGAVPLPQGIADVASQLAKSIPEGHPMTVAVTDFPDLGGQTCRLGRYVAERLSTLLSQHEQCRLIERRRLDMVLQELKFSMSELVDPAKARKLGQMLGVQGLVIGTTSDVGNTLDVDARIIDIQTDVSLPGASASVVKDDAVRSLTANCTASVTPPVGSGGGAPVGGQPPQPNPPAPVAVARAVVQDFIFQVKSCGMKETTVTCHLTITDTGEDTELYFAGRNWNSPRPTRMIDGSGNEYLAGKLQLGNQVNTNGGDIHGVLATGVPMAAAVVFENVSPDATTISLLEFPCGARGRNNFNAQLRNVPISKQ
jgi:TolB-like protein